MKGAQSRSRAELISMPLRLSDLVPRLAAAATAVTLTAHAMLELTWRWRDALPPGMRPVFLMHDEHGISTWVTVQLNALVGLTAVFLGLRGATRAWYLIAALFLYLSVDDATMFHERVGWFVEARIGHGFSYRWVQVMGPLLAAAGLASFAFLWHQARAVGGCRGRLWIGYSMLALALGLEVLERGLSKSALAWRGFSIDKYLIPIEESLELLAPALILTCLLRLVESKAARDERP
jgi:hypothetical protein